jgi:hypothetical protein
VLEGERFHEGPQDQPPSAVRPVDAQTAHLRCPSTPQTLYTRNPLALRQALLHPRPCRSPALIIDVCPVQVRAVVSSHAQSVRTASREIGQLLDQAGDQIGSPQAVEAAENSPGAAKDRREKRFADTIVSLSELES